MVDSLKPISWFFKGGLRNAVRNRARLVVMLTGVILTVAMPSAEVEAATGSVIFPGTGTSLSNLAFSPTISVPNNASVGQSLQWQSYVPGFGTSNVTCPVNETVVVNGTAAPGKTDIFMTNVPGIGVRYSVTQNYLGSFTTVPYSTTFSPPATTNTLYYIGAELVVTGPVGNGTLTTIPSLTITFSGNCFDTVTRTQYVTAGSTVTASTCSVTTSSIQVSLLPGVSPSSLASAGATSGATPFSIGLDCPAAVNAYVSLTDASNPANRSTILSASADSTAKGVGMQISSGSTVLSFGPSSAEMGDMNTWSVGRMNAGANLIPLVARYARTGPVSGGTVKGLATFTMTYQ